MTGPDQTDASPKKTDFVQELVDYFLAEGFFVHSARGVEGFKNPQPVVNNGFGKALPRRPDVVAFDKQTRRVIFGIVRTDSRSLASEDSLEEYNVFLDHNSAMKEQASVLYVMIPQRLVQEFMSMITHYIHRDYWHRIIPVTAGERSGSG